MIARRMQGWTPPRVIPRIEATPNRCSQMLRRYPWSSWFCQTIRCWCRSSTGCWPNTTNHRKSFPRSRTMPNDPVGTVNVPLRAAPSDPMWPHRTLDVRGLYDTGWRPRPFRDFVLKVHQKCNLACDYCYVYTMPDRTWRGRPMVMSPDVWQAAGEAIGNHIRAHDLSAVRVILHGGEPLLAGEERLAAL